VDPAKDYWRYGSTLMTIKMNIFVQKEQLNVTLSNLGSHGATTLLEVEDLISKRYPAKYEMFMDIIRKMESILAEMMEKLDIDANGKVS
jgi:hypothetical protein